MFEIPKLNYAYDALEPVISKEIMELHHSKHHAAYVSKLNAALQNVDSTVTKGTIEDILRNLADIPEEFRTTIRNNGGGHYSHSLFWQCMSPHGGGTPGNEFTQAVEQKYGSFDAFIEQFNTAATGLFGSGWVWLQPDLSILSLPNQDNALMSGGSEPLMGLDVWEHAYYLDYKNVRADYIKEWWKVVDWNFVEARYKQLG